MSLDLDLFAAPYAVCRLAPAAVVPEWAENGELLSVTRTAEELSIVCPQDRVPEGVRCERDFRVLKIRGPLDFSMVGVLSGLAGPLAAAGISLFVLSTFDTDILLVKQVDLGRAAEVLLHGGHNVLGPF
jgi:uncharacterized protein